MVNLPTVATILTCHVGILSVYRSVFSRIHDALRTCGVPSSAYEADLASPQKKATITCPPSPKKEMLPLNTPCVLGLRVQLEMMTHMLDRMRAAWATAMEGHPSHEDQQQEQEKRQQDRLWLRRRATLETLKSMLALQGHELSCQDSGMGISAVGDLGDKIRRLLRNCDKGMY
ncbi:Pyrichalasin H cluster regulator bc2 [Pyricularia grisea]|nr:Pyrichalasin H cluster regulator bc2 [Pyricularia grisea]